MSGRGRWSRRTPVGYVTLAVLAYLPAVLSSPGSMPADTKLGLYLNPGRLISQAHLTWDRGLFGGWVPHQMVAYLWPTGPWYWLGDRLGLPDWLVHRLWIGTLMVAAGAGVMWLARRLGLTLAAAWVAAVVYQCSPYVLAYVSRTSVMLLPWAAVGWLTGLAATSVLSRGWRAPAAVGLVVATVGSVNATALAMVLPAPVLMMLSLRWQGRVSWRQLAAAAGRLLGIGVAVSLWWIVMVSIQRRSGADVLAYSETLRDVSSTATSTEAMRGLGYWLFYMGDSYARTTTASAPYMTSPGLIAAGWSIVVVAVGALATVRWAHRQFAALCLAAGVVLAVGPYPFGHSVPFWRLLGDGGAALAIRSSTRAVPVALLGVSLAAGAGVTAARRWRPTLGSLTAAAVAILAVVNLPSLWLARYVDPALAREQDPPDAWLTAARALDASGDTSAVLVLPGQEFGAFTWGYTVDPPLASLTRRPVLTRDLLPLGSAATMDLLYALDDRLQDGTVEPAMIAPVARLLGAGTIWLAQDQDPARFRTMRPVELRRLVDAGVPGLAGVRDIGAPQPPANRFPVVDESTLTTPDRALSPVALAEVGDPRPDAATSTRAVLVAGSGDGLVDAAAAGLLDGTEAVYYAADRTQTPSSVQLVVLTDSNRARAHQWRGSQDVTGYTEGPGLAPTSIDTADARLPVFPGQTPTQQTTSAIAGLAVRASSYGEPFAYRPEDRPAMAVDGDPATAWRVGDRGDPVGQSLTVEGSDEPLVIRQDTTPGSNRRITEIRVDWTAPTPGSATVALDERSEQGAGQRVDGGTGRRTITITKIAARGGGADSGPSAVGLAEIGPVGSETIVLPSLTAAQAPDRTPLAVVLTRLRHDPADRWRADPEPVLSRSFQLPTARTFLPQVTLRLDRRAPDAVLARWFGGPRAVATRRLAGSLMGGWAALDGDRATSWTTPFDQAVGSALDITIDPSTPLGQLTIHQPTDEVHSTITELTLSAGSSEVRVAVPAPDATGASTVTLPAPLSAASLRVTISAVTGRTVTDRRYGEIVQLPAAVVDIDGITAPRAPATSGAACRDDLLTIDGHPVGIRLTDDTLGRLLTGADATVGICAATGVALPAGEHHVGSTAGARTGIQVDRVVLASGSVDPSVRGAPVALAPWQRPAGPGQGAQRLADAAIIASALAVAACLVIVLRRRPQSHSIADQIKAEPGQWTAPSQPGAPTVSAAVLVVLGLAFAGPWGVLGCVTVAGVVLVTRRAGLMWPIALAGACLQGAGLLAGQLLRRAAANGAWPGTAARLHQLGLVVVLTLASAALTPVVSGAVAAWRGRRTHPSGSPRPSTRR